MYTFDWTHEHTVSGVTVAAFDFRAYYTVTPGTPEVRPHPHPARPRYPAEEAEVEVSHVVLLGANVDGNEVEVAFPKYLYPVADEIADWCEGEGSERLIESAADYDDGDRADWLYQQRKDDAA